MERQREGRSLSDPLDNQSSRNLTEDVGDCVDKTSKAAAAAASDLAEDRDEDEDEDLSYDEHDSIGERSTSIYCILLISNMHLLYRCVSHRSIIRVLLMTY